MPELPEVETVMRGLIPALLGQTIDSVTVRAKALRRPLPKGFARRLTGRTVQRLHRRAKYILAELDGNESWAIHLGMSGRIAIHPEPVPLGPHDHVALQAGGRCIVYTDPRRFGLMALIPTEGWQADPLFAGLGPEPLDPAFDRAALATALRGCRAPIKAALLDQSRIAGLGNIYVCEALFAARIAPTRPAETVSNISALREAIQAVLQDALASGGSSLRDYRHTDGSLGYFQHRFRVYDREGERCLRRACPGTIARIVQSGRSTFFCPRCQR